MKPQPERRVGTLRRQVNESFCSPDGSFSITKTIAIAGQIVLLYHLGKDFDDLIDKWDALLLTAGFVIAPDTLKAAIKLKWGNGSAKPNPDGH